MTRTNPLNCACRCRMEAVDPTAGDILRCSGCGGVEACDGDPDRREPGILDVVREELGSLLKGLGFEDLACPGCDAIMAVAATDDGKTVGVCQHCGRRAELKPRRRSSEIVRQAS